MQASLGIAASQPVPVIAVDGPSGVGKGTTSALIAERLGFHLLDSGRDLPVSGPEGHE